MLTINNTIDGAIRDIEIKGNTVQDPDNLSDIKSVGELQEDGTYKMSILSCGKNLFNLNDEDMESGKLNSNTGDLDNSISGWKRMKKSKFIKSGVYILSSTVKELWRGMCLYDENGSFISYVGHSASNSKITILNDCYYKLHLFTSLSLSDLNIQLEEGTQATTYEPYQGNKCDILLPCQLEKVGDVADRIICKDGVWGVEKSVKTIKFTGNEEYTTNYPNSTYFSIKCKNLFNIVDINNDTVCIINSDKYLNRTGWTESSFSEGNDCIFNTVNTSGYFQLTFIRQSGFDSLSSCVNYVKNNNFEVKVQLVTPQFIPLPRNTQIALNSFFGTTHVYMESGEVEGTIKCKIPKSLGATVQSLNNKTDILSDRIEAIEGLKDSQNMKYETDKGYLVCKETKNGVIDDLKIEGKTLVNLAETLNSTYYTTNNGGVFSDNTYSSLDGGSFNGFVQKNTSMYKPNTTYTAIVNIKSNTASLGLTVVSQLGASLSIIQSSTKIANPNQTGVVVFKFTTKNSIASSDKGFNIICNGTFTGQFTIKDLIILEGDHTQNPPSYFEGLMSVGEDVDEMSIESHNDNLFNGNVIKNITLDHSTGQEISYPNEGTTDFIKVFSNKLYFSTDAQINSSSFWRIATFDGNKSFINVNQIIVNNKEFTLPSNTKYVRLTRILSSTPYTYINLTYNSGKPFNVGKQDKKQILFYNENGELEPIQELHEWDSIEKHSDNKWYYHKRSGKVVLNGSEEWHYPESQSGDNTILLYSRISNAKINQNYPICDIFNGTYLNIWEATTDIEGVVINHNKDCLLRLNKTKLSSQDVTGFKQWLQANNVTVVYQLAEEEVYEIAPLHLDSYANETLILCNSGAISPKMEFSITSHINELVKAYGERINLLEEKVYQYMVAQNRLQLASTYSADSVTFKVDYFSLCGDEENYDEDLYNLILNNILVGKDNYDYDKMFTMILDYASWNQISWEQFDILVGLMDMQHNPPIEELPPEDVIEEDIIENETPVE